MDPLQMLMQLRGGGRVASPSGKAAALQQMMGQMSQKANPPQRPQAPEVGRAPQPQYQADEAEAESAAPTADGPQSDEQMLETVRQGMDPADATPPPGSAMKWMNVDEDKAALMADPSPENVQAFTEYWGEDQLPPELQESAPDSESDQDY